MKSKKLNPLQKRAIANEKALASGFMNLTKEELEKEKRRLARKNVGGIISLLSSEAQKKKRKTGSDAMKAKGMTPADRMSEGGQMVKSKRTRSIDGIASKGKTRGTQR